MIEAINALIETIMASPWALLAIFLVSLLDAFFPVVPSETTVIAGGALAATGGLSLPWMILAALAGALIGDHVSYGIGRLAGTRAAGALLRGDKGRAARAWAEDMLRIRGGLAIVALRFVPGGRTATTLTAGTLSYPLPRFTAFASVAALLWATYGGLVGYLAGGLFRGNHLLAVAVGIGISVVLSAVAETARYLLRRRRLAGSAAPRAPVGAARPGGQAPPCTSGSGAKPSQYRGAKLDQPTFAALTQRKESRCHHRETHCLRRPLWMGRSSRPRG